MDDLSRRLLLRAIAATLGAAALPAGWVEIAAGETKLSFFSAAEAADVEAVAAQIVPTDDTPGAREAGVINFIDRALATFLSQLAGDYRTQLAEFQAEFRKQHPAAATFASLTSDQQIEYLKTIVPPAPARAPSRRRPRRNRR
jgi:gluconate 2-dehydrogenase gamma chain